MRILHIFFSFQLGGAETMLVDIMNRQILTNEVGLCIINKVYSEELLNQLNSRIIVIRLNRVEGRKNIIDLIKLNYRILQFKPQIIHSHNSNIILYLPISAFIKTVCTIHGNNLPCKGIHLYKEVYAISQSVFSELQEKRVEKLSLVYNGIDINKISIFDQEYGKVNSEFKIVQVGRLEHNKKGQHILLEALFILKKKYNYIDITLDIIGEGQSVDFLLKLIDKHELGQQVRLLGSKPRSYIYSHLKYYDLLVHPSIYEGFGLTIVEAMVAALPVLVADSGGPLEVVNQGDTGYVFKTQDAVSLANKLYWIINQPRQVRDMALKGRQYVIDKFSINNTVANYEENYKRLLQK